MITPPRPRPPTDLSPTSLPATPIAWLLPMFAFMAALPLMVYQTWTVYAFPVVALLGMLASRRSDRYGLLFVALLPLSLSKYFTLATFDGLPTPIRLSVLALIVLALLLYRGADFRFAGTAWCWGLFLLIVACSTGFLSMYPQVSYLKLGFAGFFLGSLLFMTRGSGEYPSVVFGTMSGIIVASLIAFVAFPVVGYMFTFSGDSVAGRFSGVLAHPQLLSCLVAVSLPLFIHTYVSGQGLQRTWALWAVGLAFVLMIITSSRGGMLAGLVSSGAILVLLIFRPSSPPARRRAWGLALILAAAGFIGAFLAADSIRGFVFKNEDADVLSLSGREEIIEQSWTGFLARPVLGNGFQVPSEFTEHGAASFGADDNVSIEKCFFLTMILEETGAVGGLLFLSGLGLLLLRAYKTRSFVFIACLLGFLTVNLSEAVIFSPSSLGGLCWLICFSTHRLRT
jgi:hypothetical protein